MGEKHVTTTDVTVPPHADFGAVERLVEKVYQAEGLTATSKNSLASFPESVHWHFKREGEKEVLELTLWPTKRRLWASVHANRVGSWTEDSLERVRRGLERALA